MAAKAIITKGTARIRMPKMAMITAIKTDQSQAMDTAHMNRTIGRTNTKIMEIKCRIIIQTTPISPMEWKVQMAATSTM